MRTRARALIIDRCQRATATAELALAFGPNYCTYVRLARDCARALALACMHVNTRRRPWLRRPCSSRCTSSSSSPSRHSGHHHLHHHYCMWTAHTQGDSLSLRVYRVITGIGKQEAIIIINDFLRLCSGVINLCALPFGKVGIIFSIVKFRPNICHMGLRT